MPNVLLFCVAEQAKAFVHKALSLKVVPAGARSLFYLVESRSGPGNGQEFKQVLAEGESFETDFIGASEQDCREWAFEQQSQNNMVEQNLIAIADKRSASDDTLSIQFYSPEPGINLPGYGILPRENNTWHEFRVIYKEATYVFVALKCGEYEVFYPDYFGRKDEFTDERGIFNAGGIEELWRT